MDIGFGVTFQPSVAGAGGRQELMASQRIMQQAEVYKVTGGGTLLLSFDNSYSYMRSKTASFSLEFMQEDQYESQKQAAEAAEAATAAKPAAADGGSADAAAAEAGAEAGAADSSAAS